MWFQVDITPVIKGGASEVLLEINEHHKRRKIAHPARLSIINEQTVRYEDSRYLLSPYRVMEQETVYIFPKEDILDYTKQPEANWDRRGIKYGPLRNMQPFSFDLISLHLKMPNPQLILGEARKTIHVSHWGFISVDEYFALENVGAKLKGEFSRVDFTKRDNAKNCMRQISAKFPWYIQNLYFHDYIGNISTTHAFREEEHVKVGYSPRYPVCGGWKVDWNQGYTVPTKYHLRLEDASSNLYKLDIPFMYNYDVLLAENYTLEIILPYGASEIEVSFCRFVGAKYH